MKNTPQNTDQEKKTDFRKIKNVIIGRIQNRDLLPGASLPTEVQLAEEFGCARATVNRALRELSDAGLLDRKRRSGTRVAIRPDPQVRLGIPLVRREVEAMGAAYRYARLNRDMGPAPGWLRARLDLPAGAEVMHLSAMHYAGAQPFQHEERWINVEAVPQVRDLAFEDQGANEWLLDNVPFSQAETGIMAVPANPEMARHLGSQEGAPLLRLNRVTWFRGQPVTSVALTYHAGYRLHANR